MTDHVKAIEERIAFHREEISKLETALEVIRSLGSASEAPRARLAGGPAAKRKGPAKAARRNGMAPAEVRARVEEALAGAQKPLTSAQVAEMLGMKETRQPVYQALHALKASGKAVRDAEGRYAPQPADGQ